MLKKKKKTAKSVKAAKTDKTTELSAVKPAITPENMQKIVDQLIKESTDLILKKTMDKVSKDPDMHKKLSEIFGERSYYVEYSDYGWVSFYDYFTRIGVINHEKFNKYRDLIKSRVFCMYAYESIVFAVQPPKKIIRNTANRLHNPNGYAYEFRDGTGAYFINGRHIPDEIFNKAATLTREEFIKEPNNDYKGAWYAILGQKKIMDMLGAGMVDECQIVHKNGDLETVSLWKTKETFAEIDNKPFAWVKMICPSTGTQYLSGVEPHHTKALDAIASLSRFEPSDYSFHMRS